MSRTNSSFNFNETFKYDHLDRLTEHTNARGLQELQSYDNRGRITSNPLGSYNYSQAKPYRNNSIDINTEATSYFQNREGIFNDGMEEKKGWLIYEPSIISFDETKFYTGKTSLKINNPSTTEKITTSDVWIPIDNTVATEYKYSVWVFSTAPQAEIFLYMKTANEVNPFTLVNQKTTNVTNQWVKLEGTMVVPANIKKLNIRLDNNGLGTIWFDDVRIRKSSNAPTVLRELNISYSAFKAPIQIEETGVDKISFVYNEFQGRSSMFYGGLETDKMQRRYRKHYSADGTMEIKQDVATGAVEFISYIGGDGYSAPIVLKSDGTTQEYLYLLRDYQGSILEIYNEQTVVLEKRIFDAWGKLIKVQDGQGNILSKMSVLDRGYTGHEHLLSVGLINMNGRLYDPILHRFLQPDNNIQDPSNTQNFNRYGYVLNNPLKYTDPSGETSEGSRDCIDCGISAETLVGMGVLFAKAWDDMGMKDGLKSAGNWFTDNLKSFADDVSDFVKGLFGGGSRNQVKVQTFAPTSESFMSNLSNGNQFTSFQSNNFTTGNSNSVQVHPYIAVSSRQSAVSESVGQPGDWESVIPVWGSGRAAVDHFQNGNYWRGAGYTALAISDVFLIKAAYTAIAKGVAVGTTKIAASKGLGLSDDVAKTFRFGRYKEIVLDKPMTLSRYYDNVGAFAKGRYMTNSTSRFVFLDRMGLALKPSWNKMTKVAHWEIPAGTTIYRGKAGMQFPWFGGKTQFFIPELEGIKRVIK